MNYRLRSSLGHQTFNVVKSEVGEHLQPNPAADHPAPAEPEVKKPDPLPEPMPHPPGGPILVNGKYYEPQGSYDEVMPAIRRLVPKGNPKEDWIFHIGGCQGSESTLLYEHFFKPMVVLEPDSRNLQKLRRRMHDLVQTHGIEAKVYPFAASDRNGRTKLRLSNYKDRSAGAWTESNTIMPVALHTKQSPELDWSEEVEIGTVSLDSLWTNMGCPVVHMIYSDAEGAEGLILKGAQSVLKHCRYFFSEFSFNLRYEGCLNLEQTVNALPGKWSILQVFGHGHAGDALLRNEDFHAS